MFGDAVENSVHKFLARLVRSSIRWRSDGLEGNGYLRIKSSNYNKLEKKKRRRAVGANARSDCHNIYTWDVHKSDRDSSQIKTLVRDSQQIPKHRTVGFGTRTDGRNALAATARGASAPQAGRQPARCARSASMTGTVNGSCPRQSRNDSAACSTSIPRPSVATDAPSLAPHSTNGVGFAA